MSKTQFSHLITNSQTNELKDLIGREFSYAYIKSGFTFDFEENSLYLQELAFSFFNFSKFFILKCSWIADTLEEGIDISKFESEISDNPTFLQIENHKSLKKIINPNKCRFFSSAEKILKIEIYTCSFETQNETVQFDAVFMIYTFSGEKVLIKANPDILGGMILKKNSELSAEDKKLYKLRITIA